MLYLNQNDIVNIGTEWINLIEVIKNSVKTIEEKDFAQPIKPYLRYKDLTNRIIAMPAYIGGDIAMSGLKWIASFPKNIDKGILRANSITVLNEVDTGVPLCIINTTLVSGIRTAAVSGLMVSEYLKHKKNQPFFNVGIVGFGPIGNIHLRMVSEILGEKLGKIFLFDIREIDDKSIPENLKDKVIKCEKWEDVYADADILITCTVSDKPYIDKAPKKGSLQLNVSLRDYKPEMRKHMNFIVVDDWDEICRQNTDIEVMHKTVGLQPEETHSITDLVCREVLKDLKEDEVVMFNPMGMD